MTTSRDGVADRLEGIRRVEQTLQEVYNYCPPTRTYFASPEARTEYRRFWGEFFQAIGVPPEAFDEARLLDVGCGSCEKASFYDDWGARVTGVDLCKEVIALARESIGNRDVELICSSLFDLDWAEQYDIAIIDGVSFLTGNTFQALEAVTRQLRPGGLVIFSITNVWGRFWWFAAARRMTSLLGGHDFHRRAAWGRRLFLWTRRRHEGTAQNAQFFRSEQSWAYDWFGPPVYHLHSPRELRRWLARLGLTHLGSVPPLLRKGPSRRRLASFVEGLAGDGPRLMSLFWLANQEPNMAYVAARKERV